MIYETYPSPLLYSVYLAFGVYNILYTVFGMLYGTFLKVKNEDEKIYLKMRIEDEKMKVLLGGFDKKLHFSTLPTPIRQKS